MVDDGDLRLSFLFRRLIQPKHWPTVLDRLLRADGMTDQQLKRTLDTGALQVPEPAHRRRGILDRWAVHAMQWRVSHLGLVGSTTGFHL